MYFRASTKEKADELGVTGFVRNEADGSVFIAAQGEESKLQQLLDWAHEGPKEARVDKVEITKQLDVNEDEKGFEIPTSGKDDNPFG